MGVLFGDSGGKPLIESIQSGTIEIGAAELTGTATITSVDTDNSVVLFNGWSTDDGAQTEVHKNNAYLSLTNSTTITATRGHVGPTVTIAYTVIEFKAEIIRSVQAGTISVLNGSISAEATITAVVVEKSAVFYGGFSTIISYYDNCQPRLELTDTTTVTATRTVSDHVGPVVAYTVVEFY